MSSFVRNIAQDLVQKRLWPVAVALIAAIVAVPMILGGGSDGAPASSAALAPTSPGTQQAAVTLADDDQTTPVRTRSGKLSNPFKSLLPKVTEPAGTSSSASTGTSSSASTGTSSSPSTAGSGSSTGGASTGGTSTGGTSTGGTTTTPKAAPQPDPIDTYRLTLRFGVSGAKLKTYRDVQRLTPLPSSTSPFFVYLGVLSDATDTAVFVVSADAKPTGDGKCFPSAANCGTLRVKEGETVFFDTTVDGKPVKYQLHLLHVKATKTTADASTSSAVAAAAAVMRDAHVRGSHLFAAAERYRWLPGRDVLVRVASKTARRRAAKRPLPGVAIWNLDRS